MPRDPNQRAKKTLDLIIQASESSSIPNVPTKEKPDEKEKNPAAVALGRLGGLKGGKVRAQRLTPEQRSESARKAVMARWVKKSTANQS